MVEDVFVHMATHLQKKTGSDNLCIAGGVGLNCVMGAALVGAHPVIVADLVDSKLETAMDFGATHVVNAGTQDLSRPCAS